MSNPSKIAVEAAQAYYDSDPRFDTLPEVIQSAIDKATEELWDRLKGRDEPLRLALLAAAMNADERNEWKQRAENAEAATAGMVPIEDVKPLLDRIDSDVGNHYCAEIPAFLAKHGYKLK